MANTPADNQSNYMIQMRRKRLYGGLTILVFTLLLASGFDLANSRNAGGFINGLPNVFDFPISVWKDTAPKLDQLPGHLTHYFPALVETINIAAVSTLIGALLATILSLLSTRGLARWPRFIPMFRRIMDIMRAVPEIVIALVLIFVLGGGPVPAMIALAFHTSGALGKLFSEVNENADLKPVEGLNSVGASWFQSIYLGIIPQVIPNYLSYALLRFEINIRASAILGFVGAGGIGYELKNAMSWGQGKYDEAAALFILLFGTIVFFDQLSSYIRNHIVRQGAR